MSNPFGEIPVPGTPGAVPVPEGVGNPYVGVGGVGFTFGGAAGTPGYVGITSGEVLGTVFG